MTPETDKFAEKCYVCHWFFSDGSDSGVVPILLTRTEKNKTQMVLNHFPDHLVKYEFIEMERLHGDTRKTIPEEVLRPDPWRHIPYSPLTVWPWCTNHAE